MDVKNLSFSYTENNPILKDVSLTLKKGGITTLIGANGCGKTTLLKLMGNNLTPRKGEIFLDGKSLADYPLRKFARHVAIVHQKNAAPDDLTVRRLVAYGRIPYTSILSSGGSESDEKVKWAMEATGITDLADSSMGTLSGGQRQRAFIAMALAQDTRFLFLDEPTTFLDVRYQIEILRLIRKLNKDFGITIVMVLHDINQALTYSDEIIGLKDGHICVKGAPNDVMCAEVIKEIYDIELDVFERDGKLFVMMV